MQLRNLPIITVFVVLDAFAKPGAGIQTGATNMLGSYDECIGVTSYWNSSLPEEWKFSGKYCTAGVTVGVSPMGQPG